METQTNTADSIIENKKNNNELLNPIIETKENKGEALKKYRDNLYFLPGCTILPSHPYIMRFALFWQRNFYFNTLYDGMSVTLKIEKSQKEKCKLISTDYMVSYNFKKTNKEYLEVGFIDVEVIDIDIEIQLEVFFRFYDEDDESDKSIDLEILSTKETVRRNLI